ncbi:hypothetical protein [uncultured Sphingomonas sp.]|uniref:hypothetical protein n=1 Tax=uncultured Sphingomonas sp. TaxID=158754 RepID=UPI0035CBA49B
MGETVISPTGPGACEVGLMIDETGTRFVVLTFREPDVDPVIVTFTVPLFQNYVGYLHRAAEAAADEASWAMEK